MILKFQPGTWQHDLRNNDSPVYLKVNPLQFSEPQINTEKLDDDDDEEEEEINDVETEELEEKEEEPLELVTRKIPNGKNE